MFDIVKYKVFLPVQNIGIIKAFLPAGGGVYGSRTGLLVKVLFLFEVIMKASELTTIIKNFVGLKKDPEIEIFTNVEHPADLISIEYCKENNVLYFKYETKNTN